MKGLYVGIDNGISGAVTVLNQEGAITSSFTLPSTRGRAYNELDVRTFHKLMYDGGLCRDTVKAVVVEAPGGSQSAAAAVVMSGVFHALRAYLDLFQFRWERVTPQAWQKVLLGANIPKGTTKALALDAARRLWPVEKFLATDRSKVPHEGIVDAALIAEYGRRFLRL